MSKTTLKKFSRFGLLVVLGLVAASCQLSDYDQGGALRPYYCSPTDTAINDGHSGGGGHMPHYTVEKGPLSAANCLTVSLQLSIAQNYAAQFPTAGVAEANGFTHIAPWIPGQGTHHLNNAQGVTSNFNALQPNLLMYDSNADNAKLTGMVWAVVSNNGPPAGFAGDNDHWHFHESLCYLPSGFIVGDSISDALCASRGGTNVDTSNIWLLHVWLPEYQGIQMSDVFNKSNPAVN